MPVSASVTITVYDYNDRKLFTKIIPEGFSNFKMREDTINKEHTITVEKVGYKTTTFKFLPWNHIIQDHLGMQVILDKDN